MIKLIFIILRGIKLFLNYFRSNLLSFFALSALFLILHTAFGLGAGMASFADSVASFDTIRVYLSSSDDETIKPVQAALDNLAEAESTLYYSPEDAKRYIERETSSLSGVDALPNELFPAFIELIVRPEHRDIAQLEALSSKIEQIAGVEQASYGQEWAEQLSRGKNAVLSMLTILSALFAIVGAVLIYQTVSITMYRYNKEVRVYSMVGGTGAFIGLPFVVTAACTGALCSVFSLLVYALFRIFLLRPIEQVLGLNLSISLSYAAAFSAVALCVSMLAGMISARHFIQLTGSED